MSGVNINELARTTLDFLASNRELQHDAAILALFLVNFGRWDFIDAVASGAFDLLRSRDELEHRSAVVTNEMTFRHWCDSFSDAELTVG